MSFIFIIIVAVALFIFLNMLNAQDLRTNGQRVSATVTEIRHRIGAWNPTTQVRSADTYQVVAIWHQEMGETKTFQSGWTSSRPNCQEGDPIIVFVDKQNINRYYVDV